MPRKWRASDVKSPSTIFFPKCLCWSLLSLSNGLSPHYTSLPSTWARKTPPKTKSSFEWISKPCPHSSWRPPSVIHSICVSMEQSCKTPQKISVGWNWFVGTNSPLSVLFSPSSTAYMNVSQLHSYNSPFLSLAELLPYCVLLAPALCTSTSVRH